ncbi:hypothetical protein evm_012495 [Chilo suppressalis]|nr:hypothetical protein evm_012495 [Chilo suppressalis]
MQGGWDNLVSKGGRALLPPCRRPDLENCPNLPTHITIQEAIKGHPHSYTLDCPCGRHRCYFLCKLDHGSFDIIFTALFFAACIQLWIPCYLGTLLRNKAFDVGDACWNCGWHETSLGRLVRMDIIIIILRSQKPLSIKFIGLPNLSLETFSSIMSSAYSYFNMLRQYN